MLGKKKKYNEIYRAKINSIVGESTTIEGHISFSGNTHIAGTVVGNVSSDSKESLLILSEGGLIIGDVTVNHLIVNGQIDGNVYVKGKVELFDKARINGDVNYNLLELPVGAEVNGKLIRMEQGE